MKIICGDCLDVMAGLPDNHIDTIITDPPYGLTFMGKHWDHGVPGVDFWREALRVAKPGATLMAFGGTRTHHRLMVAIEDAGWEIRDCIMWLYGSGFPKSYNISKGIDKAAGAESYIVQPGANGKGKKTVSTYGDGLNVNFKPRPITAPATPEAAEWEGWGSGGLKPAYEPIILAQKPVEGGYVANALRYGVAGLWIDGGRVDFQDSKDIGDPKRFHKTNGGAFLASDPANTEVGLKGRWPANVIHDGSDEVLAGFPVTGKSSGGVNYPTPKFKNQGGGNTWKSKPVDNPNGFGFGDTGSAARFFYCAKASKSERGEYNNHPTVKPLALLEYLCKLTRTPTGGLVLDPFAGSGSTALAAMATGRDWLMIEKEPGYCAIIRRRVAERSGAGVQLAFE